MRRIGAAPNASNNKVDPSIDPSKNGFSERPTTMRCVIKSEHQTFIEKKHWKTLCLELTGIRSNHHDRRTSQAVPACFGLSGIQQGNPGTGRKTNKRNIKNRRPGSSASVFKVEKGAAGSMVADVDARCQY